MRYWVYINDKVEGPFEEDKLVTLNGFTPDTLICAEDTSNSGNQEWVKASSIFEFDQDPAPQQTATASAPAATPAADNMTAMLLAKLDALTSQLTDMQHKIDGMQNQLDAAARRNEDTPATVNADQQAHTISLTRHDLSDEISPADLPQIQEEENTAQVGTDSASKEEKPLDMLEPLAMESSPINETSEVVLENKEEEESIVSAALNSMYAAQHIGQDSKDSKEGEEESAFQDLLNPTQAKELEEETKQKADQIQANPQPESAVSAEVSQAEADSEREALITALTSSQNNPTADNVVDQVIQEHEADKEQDTIKLSGVATAAAAGAAIVAGAVALAGNNNQEDEKKAQEEAADAALDAQLAQQLPDQSGAANKEEVLPADQLPPDVEPKENKDVTYPTLFCFFETGRQNPNDGFEPWRPFNPWQQSEFFR